MPRLRDRAAASVSVYFDTKADAMVFAKRQIAEGRSVCLNYRTHRPKRAIRPKKEVPA